MKIKEGANNFNSKLNFMTQEYFESANVKRGLASSSLVHVLLFPLAVFLNSSFVSLSSPNSFKRVASQFPLPSVVSHLFQISSSNC